MRLDAIGDPVDPLQKPALRQPGQHPVEERPGREARQSGRVFGSELAERFGVEQVILEREGGARSPPLSAIPSPCPAQIVALVWPPSSRMFCPTMKPACLRAHEGAHRAEFLDRAVAARGDRAERRILRASSIDTFCALATPSPAL
jgi:hypothetical protein